MNLEGERENLDELEERAKATLAGKTRGYVEDARIYAKIVLAYVRLVREHETMVKELLELRQR